MKETAFQQRMYAPGHSEHELDRLSHQAEAFEPFTRQSFQQAGITARMRVLDVGCGSGDVAFLAAELVGPSGEVIGADLAAEAVNRATALARARGIGNVRFLEGDPAELRFDSHLTRSWVGSSLCFTRTRSTPSANWHFICTTKGSSFFRSLTLPPPFPCRQPRPLSATLLGSNRRLALLVREYTLALNCRSISGRRSAWPFHADGCPDRRRVGLSGVRDRRRGSQEPLSSDGEVENCDCEGGRSSSLAQRMRDEVVASNGVVLSPGLIGAWSSKS